MNDEKKAKIRKAAETAAVLFEENGWIWATLPVNGVPTVDDIYKEYRRMAKKTRAEVSASAWESTENLGRLIVRSIYQGTQAHTGKPWVLTEFGVETGYVV